MFLVQYYEHNRCKFDFNSSPHCRVIAIRMRSFKSKQNLYFKKQYIYI